MNKMNQFSENAKKGFGFWTFLWSLAFPGTNIKGALRAQQMELFPKIVKDWKPLNLWTRIFILHVWLGSKCASEHGSKKYFPLKT